VDATDFICVVLNVLGVMVGLADVAGQEVSKSLFQDTAFQWALFIVTARFSCRYVKGVRKKLRNRRTGKRNCAKPKFNSSRNLN
jgi:hypothetical protein